MSQVVSHKSLDSIISKKVELSSLRCGHFWHSIHRCGARGLALAPMRGGRAFAYFMDSSTLIISHNLSFTLTTEAYWRGNFCAKNNLSSASPCIACWLFIYSQQLQSGNTVCGCVCVKQLAQLWYYGVKRRKSVKSRHPMMPWQHFCCWLGNLEERLREFAFLQFILMYWHSYLG